jgi:hypothetical protein
VPETRIAFNAVAANRPWLCITALGAAVDPDVKSRNISTDGGGSRSGSGQPV